jgi:FkbM family methyltransferase
MRRYSQHGQDSLIGDVLFKGRAGVFVDVGARDGRQFSNTIYLEEALSWTGIAVEPHPDLFRTLERTRSCRCFNVAASDVEREGLEFVKFLEKRLGNSGLLATFRDPKLLAKVKHEIISVPCVPLSRLTPDLNRIDYLDIDVEGHELQVLKGIDFSRVEVRVIGVEVQDAGPMKDEIDGFLESKGFKPFLHLRSDRFYCKGSEPPSTGRLQQYR